MEPTACSTPCAMGGLIVYLAMYLLTLELSEREESPFAAPRCNFILWAVCQVRMITSPTRPMAWESEDIMLKAPRSCRISSAAMVSLRMRDSAKATSSAIAGSRWWQTISMSRCSATVLTVYGIVGLVEEGSTFGSPQTRMMSGACPPPAPSVWKVQMDRAFMAATEVSTKAASFYVWV